MASRSGNELTKQRSDGIDTRACGCATMGSWEGIALTVVLPFLNMSMVAATYTFLPVHFLVTPGFSLSVLGLCMMVGNGCRVITATLVTRGGDWIMLGVFAITIIMHIWMLSRPVDDLLPICCAFAATYASNSILALQGLVHKKFGAEDSELKTALRIFTISETVGYATATLNGGLLYDYGGWKLCVWTQLILIIIQFVVFASAQGVRISFQKSLISFCNWYFKSFLVHVKHREVEGKASNHEREEIKHPTNKSTSEKVIIEQTEKKDDALHDAATTTVGDSKEEGSDIVLINGLKFTSSEILKSARPVIIVVLMFHYFNLFTYATEWALYAVFFREQYNWSSTWIGAGQMSGDLLAASVLLIVVVFCKAKPNEVTQDKNVDEDKMTMSRGVDEVDETSQSFFRGFVSAPYNIFFLSILIGLLNLLMVAPSFICSILAQIFMGTVYVFGIQAVNEIITVLTHGNHKLYRWIMYIHRILWDVAVSVTSLFALVAYESLGPSVPFVTVSVCMFVSAIVYITCIFHRYGCRWRVNVIDEEIAHLLQQRRDAEKGKDKGNKPDQGIAPLDTVIV